MITCFNAAGNERVKVRGWSISPTTFFAKKVLRLLALAVTEPEQSEEIHVQRKREGGTQHYMYVCMYVCKIRHKVNPILMSELTHYSAVSTR